MSDGGEGPEDETEDERGMEASPKSKIFKFLSPPHKPTKAQSHY